MADTDATHPRTTLAPLVAAAGDLAVLSDYDGSVSPMVEDPGAAVALPAAIEALRRLIPLVHTVGIVSGRAVDFLAGRVAVPGVALAGQHGLELDRSGTRTLDSAVLPFLEAVAMAASEAEDRLPGIRVERKGASVTLHWRGDPARSAEVQNVASDVAARHGLALLPGRLIVEMRPPVEADKGTAVEALSLDCKAALFAGDDSSDVAGFAALDRLVASGHLQHAVRVGVQSPESPEELIARSDVVVHGPSGLTALLETLADAIVESGRCASRRGDAH